MIRQGNTSNNRRPDTSNASGATGLIVRPARSRMRAGQLPCAGTVPSGVVLDLSFCLPRETTPERGELLAMVENAHAAGEGLPAPGA